MGGKLIILVSDGDDSKQGEISVVEEMKKAEDLLATLLEAGYEQERIRVFSGQEMNMAVSYRPVVSLSNDGRAQKESTSQTEGDQEGSASPAKETEKEPAIAPGTRFSSLFRSDSASQPEESKGVKPAPAPTPTTAASEGKEEQEKETTATTGMRFSSLFRSS